MECSGSTDPDGDPITYTFFENKSIGANESIVQDTGWTTSSGNLYSVTKLNTTNCTPCYVENLTMPTGDSKTRLSIYTAAKEMLFQFSIPQGGNPDVVTIQENLSENQSYWFAFHTVDNATAGTGTYKDDVSSNCKTGKGTIKVCGENNNAVAVWSCNTCNNRIQSIVELQMNPNETYYETLQNTTTDNFNWTGLTEGGYEWGCFLCDDNSECTGEFLSKFNVTFTKLDVDFLDEELNYTWAGIDVSLQAISDDNSYNDTTTNGSSVISLAAGNYTLRYFSNQSYERLYRISIPPVANTTLNLYMLNNTNDDAMNVSTTVISTVNEKLEDAIVKAQRYDVTCNCYKTVESAGTNFDGFTELHLVDDEFYKFLVEYPIGTSRTSTDPSYIYETELTLVIDLGLDPTEEFYDAFGVDYTLSWVNSTSSFQLVFNDVNLAIDDVCVKAFKNTLTGSLFMNQSCSSANSGTLLVTIDPEEDTTYYANAYVTIDGQEQIIDSVYHTTGIRDIFGKTGLFLILILTVLFATMGRWNPSVALILTPLPLVMGAVAKIVAISVPIAFAVWIGFIIMAIAVGRGS